MLTRALACFGSCLYKCKELVRRIKGAGTQPVPFLCQDIWHQPQRVMSIYSQNHPQMVCLLFLRNFLGFIYSTFPWNVTRQGRLVMLDTESSHLWCQADVEYILKESQDTCLASTVWMSKRECTHRCPPWMAGMTYSLKATPTSPQRHKMNEQVGLWSGVSKLL